MALRISLASVSALVVLGIGTIAAHAGGVSVTVDPLSYDIQASVNPNSTNYSNEITGPPPSLPQSIFVQIPQGSPTNYVVNGSAGATISAYPAIALSASLSNSNNPYCCTGSANAFGNMTYYFTLTENPGYTDAYTNVPVLFNGTASQSSTDSSNIGTTSTSVSMTVNPVNNSNDLLVNLPSNTSSVYSGNIQIIPNQEYQVSMSAMIYIAGTTGSVGASIDPVFTIDPNFAGANAYQLTFSDGILNANVGAPGPIAGAGLPGLILVVCGGLAWRRRSQQAGEGSTTA